MATQFDVTEELRPLVEKLLPSMKMYKVISKEVNDVRLIRSVHIIEYGKKVGMSMYIPDSDPPALFSPKEFIERLDRYASFADHFKRKLSFMDRSVPRPDESPTLKFKPAFGNVGLFGNPGATSLTSDGLAYLSRKNANLPLTPRTRKRSSQSKKGSTSSSQEIEVTLDVIGGPTAEELDKAQNSVIAQRKVAKALVQMVSNDTMLYHFVTKGGLEAINRLVKDSTDHEVFSNCTKTLLKASTQHHYGPILVEKDIMPTLQIIVEGGNDDIWLDVARILSNISYSADSRDADTTIVMNGVFPVLQGLLVNAKRQDTLCYLILTFNNLAPVFDGADTVTIVRAIIGMSGRLEVLTNIESAQFFTDILRIFSRVPRYLNVLCEESVLPVLLNTMNEFFEPQIIMNMAESFVNLSMSKKNRREIAGSGIAMYLDKIFVYGSPEAKSHVLRMIGNLLSSNLFHDRISREDTLSSLLNNLLDPKVQDQFSGVAYCLAQLATVDPSVTALVNCDVLRIVLGYLKDSPTDALGYLFTLFVTVTSKKEFVEKIILEMHLLVPFLYVQAVDGAELEEGFIQEFVGEGGNVWTQAGQKETLASLAFNLSLLTEFTASLAQQPRLMAMYVKMLKELVKNDSTELARVRLLALSSLINVCEQNKSTRPVVLGGDVKLEPGYGNTRGEDMMEIIKAIGYEDHDVNLRFVALINIISNEENLCTRLLDRGAHLMMVAIMGSLGSLHTHDFQSGPSSGGASSGLLPPVVGDKGPAGGKKAPAGGKGKAPGEKSKGSGNQENSLTVVLDTVTRRLNEQAHDELLGGRLAIKKRGRAGRTITGSSEEGKELIKEMSAAILHNLSLKRAVLGPGILTCLLSLAKGTKTIRVLHCVRTMSNVSCNMKAKLAFAKETRLIPVLVDAMRSGCDEAERVQHYGAQVICNVLAMNLDKAMFEELIKNRVVTDIVVVALLRVQGLTIKESLSKALFNLLARSEFRIEMMDLQVLSAIMELAKIESAEILELCTRCVYNITCQTALFSDRIKMNGVPAYLLNRATGFRAHDFARQPAAESSSSSTAGLSAEEQPSNEQGSSPTTSPSKGAVAAGGKDTAAESTNFSSQAKQDQLAELGLISSTTVKLLCGMGLANVSFDPSIATTLCCDMGTDALLSVFRLNSDQAAYCTAAVIFNTSHLPESQVFLSDAAYLPTVMRLMERGPILCSQLVAAALVNYSLRPPFYEQLSVTSVGPALMFMDSPAVDESIKTDILKMIFNLVCNVDSAKFRVVENDGIAILWRYVKNQEDEDLQAIVGRIIKEVCSNANDPVIFKRLMKDGIMKVLLKLAKVEYPPLKTDISYAMFDMTVGPETLKVMKWDGVDVLFWLTLHDCMNLFDTIKLNVAKALRNFSAQSIEDAKRLSLDERTVPVLKALCKSGKEEVLQHSIGTIYNLMTIEESRKVMVKEGVIKLIFELAALGWMSVRHVCSSCLHMAPEAIPDMSDPAVLELVLCLLDIDPEMIAAAEKGAQAALKNGNVGEKFKDPIPYVLATKSRTTVFTHAGTDFQHTWLTMTCDGDKIFTPALISAPQGRPINDTELKTLITEVQSGETLGPIAAMALSRKDGADAVPAPNAFGERVELHEKLPAELYDNFQYITNAVEERIANGEDYSKVSSRGDRSNRSSRTSSFMKDGAKPGVESGPETDLGQGWGFAGGGDDGGQSPSNQSKSSRGSAGKSIHTVGGGEVNLTSVPHTPMAPGQGLGQGAIIRGAAASSSQGPSRNNEMLMQGGGENAQAGGGGVGTSTRGILRSSTAPLSPNATNNNSTKITPTGSQRSTARGKENNTREDQQDHSLDEFSMSQMSRNSGIGSLTRGASVTFSDQNYPLGGMSQRGGGFGDEARGRSAPLNRANSMNKSTVTSPPAKGKGKAQTGIDPYAAAIPARLSQKDRPLSPTKHEALTVMPGQVQFPRLTTKETMPKDTLGLIRASSSRNTLVSPENSVHRTNSNRKPLSAGGGTGQRPRSAQQVQPFSPGGVMSPKHNR